MTGFWIGIALFAGFILALIEVQLYVIRGLLQKLCDHFIPDDEDDS